MLVSQVNGSLQDNLESLLTMKEVAEALRIGLSTAYLLAERGELPVVRIGRSVRVPRSALQRWIQQRVECPA